MIRTLLLVFSLPLFLTHAHAGLKVYYIRHAEGGHNVKAEWIANGVPKSEWPEYVGNHDMFTPKGEKQLLEAKEKLQNYTFDFIASSPIWRARKTLLPYLEVTDQKAEVWPELKEGTGMRLILSPDLPEVEEPVLNVGNPIHIPKAERPYFSRREGAKREYKRIREDNEELRTAYMKYVTLHAIDLIKERFGKSEKSILLSGHNSAGNSLLKLILGKNAEQVPPVGLSNTGIWMVEEQEDGSFTLKMYNDQVIGAEEEPH